MLVDLSNRDTTPGSGSVFAAPQGAVDSSWIRSRFLHDPGFRQHLVLAAIRGGRDASGPWAVQLQEALAEIAMAFKVNLNTDAGSGAPFAPPVGCTGDYVEWLRDRCRADAVLKQQLGSVARWRSDSECIVGTHHEALRYVLSRYSTTN